MGHRQIEDLRLAPTVSAVTLAKRLELVRIGPWKAQADPRNPFLCFLQEWGGDTANASVVRSVV